MSKHVLLCDDEIFILRAAEFKLRRAGYDVRIAGDGEEGWQAIQACKPDMLVTDYQMPRLDGLGLVERVRSDPATADLPVLMLTAKGFELSHEELARKWNVLGVVAKPFSPRELLARIQAVLEPAGCSSEDGLPSQPNPPTQSGGLRVPGLSDNGGQARPLNANPESVTPSP